jgi:hypothetical protein
VNDEEDNPTKSDPRSREIIVTKDKLTPEEIQEIRDLMADKHTAERDRYINLLETYMERALGQIQEHLEQADSLTQQVDEILEKRFHLELDKGKEIEEAFSNGYIAGHFAGTVMEPEEEANKAAQEYLKGILVKGDLENLTNRKWDSPSDQEIEKANQTALNNAMFTRAYKGLPPTPEQLLTSFAYPDNWYTLHVPATGEERGSSKKGEPYCHWAWRGMFRPPYEVAQRTLAAMNSEKGKGGSK